MHSEKRRFEPAVIERLFREPYRFEYFQAVRMLELWLRKHGAPDQNAVANFLRFQNSTSLRFPASQLEAVQPDPPVAPDAAALGAALQEGTLKWVRLTPTFMGLLGGQGILPPHYTERVAEQQANDKDEGPRSFLDSFSNRSLALFYEAWRKYRLHLKYERSGKDSFLPLLLGLAGLGPPALRRRLAHADQGAVLDESIAYFAAAIRQRPVSAVQMARVLSEYFGQPVEVEQFVGAWYAVPPAQQSTLGCASATLGSCAIAGERVWQRDLRLRLVVGPLDHAGFTAFLPGGLAARALASLLTLFTGLCLEYEIELVLRAIDVRPLTLCEGSELGRLGWDSYLVAGPAEWDRNDVHYDIRIG
ncbi:type VI secretion system baseplate subunit TssG [Massilia sp. Mn16-1_5]|uniref:type VI secretion system baseplate subunit TssG n=1 Tax=Massilia sp. Mn16-1_5 TaxID=2079199 RepID=UPI00109EA7DA|nr:type VI secretion system baseplate subunit TssG [Massilia sp. Mn16-1_5]THC41329.1 type VI secretion system baseplate subunit TssG [Massilia sp. Mn16-1_5]